MSRPHQRGGRRRPSMWSFDRLRLWLEGGVPPERSRDRAVAHATALAGLAACAAGAGVPGR